MNNKVSVLLVEDDGEYAFLVEKKIAQDDRLLFLGCASCKVSSIEMAQNLRPDVVVMDLSLSNGEYDGIEAAKEIRMTTEARIVFLTAHEDSDIMKKASKKAFASGYIFKSQHQTYTDEIYYAVKSRTTPQKGFIKELVLNQLTHAERAVLDHIIEGKIIGNNYISPGGSSPKTIANQKRSILRKLELKNDKELLKVFDNW